MSFSRYNISRRSFVGSVAGSLAGLAACALPASPVGHDDYADGRLVSRVTQPSATAATGVSKLGLGTSRDGFLYVPPSYSPGKPAPLIVLLHGAGRDSSEWAAAPLDDVFGSRGIVVLGPDSRGTTWETSYSLYFGFDAEFIDKALKNTFSCCAIDPARICLGGFSDGASYALSLGVTNGDLFSALMAFSPGYMAPGERVGRPRIFESHGTADTVLPIDQTSRKLVPNLRHDGYDVTYVEFNGNHVVPLDVANQAAAWFIGS